MILGIYYLVCLGIVVLNLLATVIVLQLHHQDGHRMPGKGIKYVMLQILAPLLWVNVPTPIEERQKHKEVGEDIKLLYWFLISLICLSKWTNKWMFSVDPRQTFLFQF